MGSFSKPADPTAPLVARARTLQEALTRSEAAALRTRPRCARRLRPTWTAVLVGRSLLPVTAVPGWHAQNLSGSHSYSQCRACGGAAARRSRCCGECCGSRRASAHARLRTAESVRRASAHARLRTAESVRRSPHGRCGATKFNREVRFMFVKPGHSFGYCGLFQLDLICEPCIFRINLS